MVQCYEFGHHLFSLLFWFFGDVMMANINFLGWGSKVYYEVKGSLLNVAVGVRVLVFMGNGLTCWTTRSAHKVGFIGEKRKAANTDGKGTQKISISHHLQRVFLIWLFLLGRGVRSQG
jgi:hypothetical protein